MQNKTRQLPLLTAALALLALVACSHVQADDHAKDKDKEDGFVTILGEGHTDGWTLGPGMKLEDGMIVAGTMDEPIKKTVYAAHDKEYYNFELRAQAKSVGPEKTNGGFQIRSTYNEKNGDMSGYQADMGFKYWGLIYDQSRRNRLLTKHEEGIDLQKDINWGEWNDYRVVAKDNTIKVYINGKLFSQYTEKDEDIAKVKGVIGLQLHAGPPSVRYYRNIRVKELD